MEKGALILVGLISFGLIAIVGMIMFPAATAVPQGGNGGTGTAGAGDQGNQGQAQIVNVKATAYGYEPGEITVKRGIPVEFRFSAASDAGCARAVVMRDFGVNLVSRSGETVVARFTPNTSGEFIFRCPMNMYRGRLIVQ